MVFINGHHKNILAELVNDRISQFIAEANLDIVFLTAIHIKYFCLLVGDVLFFEKFFSLPLLDKGLADTLHSIHAVIAELLAVIGIQIIVAVVPQKGVRANCHAVAVIGIVSGIGFIGRIVEVAEGNLAVLCDCLMEAVGLGNNIFVLIANAVGNIGLPVQGGNCIFSRKAFDFVGDLACFLFGDELGRLNAIHQHPQFAGFKGRVFQYPSL